MGSRYVEGHEHVLEETPNSSSASNFSLVVDAYHDDGDPCLGEAMSEAAGSQDLEPEMRSQFSQEGPKEILEGLGIESFETSVLEAAAHAGSFSDGLDSIYNGDGLADFHRRFRDDSAQDFQIDVSAYNREVVVDSAWTSLSAKPLQHFWENDFGITCLQTKCILLTCCPQVSSDLCRFRWKKKMRCWRQFQQLNPRF